MSRIERSGGQAGRYERPHIRLADIDGRNVTSISFAALANQGLTQHNPFGLAVFNSALKTVTVGFPAPLLYSESLKLSVTVNG